MRRHLTPSFFISVLALVVALSIGGSYAAEKAAQISGGKLGRNTVGSAQLKRSAVHSPDLAAGAVTSPKIKNNAVTGSKIQDRSISGADLAAGSVGAPQLAPDSVQGDAVNEATLGTVPRAATAATAGTAGTATTATTATTAGSADNVLVATVAPDAGVVAAKSTPGVRAVLDAAGAYVVTFGRDLSRCAPTATLFNDGNPPLGFVSIAPRNNEPNALLVKTADFFGNPASRGFVIHEICQP